MWVLKQKKHLLDIEFQGGSLCVNLTGKAIGYIEAMLLILFVVWHTHDNIRSCFLKENKDVFI